MKRLLILMLTGVWVTPAEAKPLDPKLAGQVDKIFADWRLAAHIPGVAYGILVDGELVHSGGIGVQDAITKAPVGTDTLHLVVFRY